MLLMRSNSSGVVSWDRLLLLRTPCAHQHQDLSAEQRDIEVAILTSSIHSIIHPPKLPHSALEQRVDLLGAGDVGFDSDGARFAFAGDFSDELLGSGEACFVAVGEDEFRAAFAGEGDGGCLADAWGVKIRVSLKERGGW